MPPQVHISSKLELETKPELKPRCFKLEYRHVIWYSKDICLFEMHTYRERRKHRKKDRGLPPTGLHPKQLHWPGADPSPDLQRLLAGPSVAAFPGTVAGNQIESSVIGTQTGAFICDDSIASISLSL